MANGFQPFRSFDLGKAYTTAQDIEYNRMRNEATGLELEETKNLIERRDQARAIREQYERIPQQVAALQAAGLGKEAQELRDSYVTQMNSSYSMLKNLADMAHDLQPGEDRQGFWDQMRKDAIDSGMVPDGSYIPEEYSPGWLSDQAANVKSTFQTHTVRWAAEDGVRWAQDFLTRDGHVLEEGDPGFRPTTPYRDPVGGRGREPWRMTSGEAGRMQSATRQLLGGRWDPRTQTYVALSRDMEILGNQIDARAEQIMREKGGPDFIGFTEAVRQAARELEVPIPDVPALDQPTDPDNLFPDGRPNPAPQ